MSYLLKPQYISCICVSLEKRMCIGKLLPTITFRSSCLFLCILIFVAVALYFPFHKKKYVRFIDNSPCLGTHSNNSIPVPSSFSLHYSLHNCSDAFNTFYSSFQCLNGNPSDLNTEDSWHERLCIFHNVCLRRDGWSKNYRIDYFYPSTMESLKSTIIRHADSILLSLRHGARAYSYDDLRVARMSLIPLDHLNTFDANRNIAYLNDTYLIYQIVAQNDMNFAHFIFDDVFGLYSSLRQFRSTRFNLPRENHVLAYKPCSSFPTSLQAMCDKFTQGIFPVITSHPIRSIDSLFDSSNRVCFRQLVAGQGLAGAVSHLAKNIHRARMFDDFRSNLLNVHGIDANIAPRQHHIVLIKKIGRRVFSNLEEIYAKIKEAPQYTDIKITILSNFTHLTVANQLRLFQTFTIVISPCGGISLLFSFLPEKATLIVSGFARSEPKGYSADRMEAIYWDYQSHLNVLHYPVDSADDFHLAAHLNKHSYGDVRNYADINLRIEKLFPLIDRAIIRAALKH